MKKHAVGFKNEYIAEYCQYVLENELESGSLKTDGIVEKDGKFVLTYYTQNYVQEGQANRVIHKLTIG